MVEVLLVHLMVAHSAYMSSTVLENIHRRALASTLRIVGVAAAAAPIQSTCLALFVRSTPTFLVGLSSVRVAMDLMRPCSTLVSVLESDVRVSDGKAYVAVPPSEKA